MCKGMEIKIEYRKKFRKYLHSKRVTSVLFSGNNSYENKKRIFNFSSNYDRVFYNLIMSSFVKDMEYAFIHSVLQAKARNIKWTIEFTDFVKLRLINKCHYCHNKIRFSKNLVQLDRKNSNKNYSINNVVPCCGNCNLTKKRMSYKDFKKLCKYLKTFNKNLYKYRTVK